MPRYRLSREAAADLEDIQTYLRTEAGDAVARLVLARLRGALRFLAERPGAGHLREDLTDEPVRFWPVFSYLIVYDPEMEPIGAARILHASRDLDALFLRQPPRSRS